MNHSGTGSVVEDKGFSLPIDLLHPLSITRGVRVWGMYYPSELDPKNERPLKHDFVLSPIPFEQWGTTARLVVQVKHKYGSFKKISEVLLSEKASVLVSEASRSGFSYDTWTLIVSFDEISRFDYDYGQKAFSETLERINSLKRSLYDKCEDVFFIEESDAQLKTPVLIFPHNAMSYFYNEYLKNEKRGPCREKGIGWAFYKRVNFVCNKNNELICNDNDFKQILSSLDATYSEFIPCNIFATMNSFDRNIRVALIPKSKKNNVFGCTIRFSRVGPPATSRGIVYHALDALPDKYNVWNMTNRTEEFSEGGEEGQLDLIVEDKSEDPMRNKDKEEILEKQLNSVTESLPWVIKNIKVSCYSLEVLLRSGSKSYDKSKGNSELKNDIFISYSTSNEYEARELESLFDKHGFRCFLSGKSLQPGDDWDNEIRESLISSHEVIFLFSPEAAKSDWVKQEYGAAWALGKRITPILLSCDAKLLPYGLKKLQAVPYHEANDGWVFLSQLRHRLAREENAVLHRTSRFSH